MRIIFVAKSRYYEQTIANNLKELCEQDSIAFFYSYSEAQDFIENNIIENQSPLDLIIAENNIDLKIATDFFQAITKDQERTYSNRDFTFCNIPVVLLVDKNENRHSFNQFGFHDVLDNIGAERLHLHVPKFRNAVKAWRKHILDELDNLGIKFNSGKIDYTYYFSNKRKRNVKTHLLSYNFQRFPRRLNYDWLINNEKQIEIAIDEFIKELKNATRLNKKREEKKFHKLFNKYPFLIKRDSQSKSWYQPRLYYNSTQYYEPDYSLKPNFNRRTDLSILEVKLPNERFIKKTKFHAKPYSSIFDHIIQVNDYKDYLESEQYQAAIKERFGFLPDSIEYNLLIGRQEDKMENISIFNKNMKQLNALHINFMTYDELLDYQVKYFERLQLINIL